MALAVAKVRAHLEEEILRRRGALRLELAVDVGREGARSRTQLARPALIMESMVAQNQLP